MRRTLAAAAITLFAVGGLAAPATASDGAANVNENANCLGVERAERNSAGGNREKGGFGPKQSALVVSINAGTGEFARYASYGKFLQAWKANWPTCT